MDAGDRMTLEAKVEEGSPNDMEYGRRSLGLGILRRSTDYIRVVVNRCAHVEMTRSGALC